MTSHRAIRITGPVVAMASACVGTRPPVHVAPAAPQDAPIAVWMISRPDGTQEGNWMGRFIDALQGTGRAPTGICDGPWDPMLWLSIGGLPAATALIGCTGFRRSRRAGVGPSPARVDE